MASVNCLRCNRRLTDPKSIDRGYGPVCAKKLGIAVGRSKFSLSLLTEQYKASNIPTLEEFFGPQEISPKEE